MSLTSVPFLLFAVVAIIVAHASDGRAWRPWAMLVLSLAFAATWMLEWMQAVLLAGFCAVVLLSLVAVARFPSLLPACLLVELGLFVWLKQYTLVSPYAPLPQALGLAGLSYVLFRGIHLTVDVAGGALQRPGALAVANYLIFFPTFVSGPIQRFEDLEPQLMRRGSSPDEAETLAAMIRAIFGCIKISLISSYVLGLHEAALGRVAQEFGPTAAALFIAATALYAIFLYVNFSGYMDVVVSLARLMGIVIPENFNHPFGAKNFLEFWTRWHITLSDWFRFYLFNPILKALTRRWPAPSLNPYLGVVAFFFTFLAMGMWHGTTGIFFIYGLLLGFGVSGNRLYQLVLTKLLGRRKYSEIAGGPLYRAVARGAVFAYFATAVSCLYLTVDQLGDIIARGRWWILLGIFCLTLIAAVLLHVWIKIEGLAQAICRRVVDASSWAHSFAFAAALLVLLGIQFWNDAPAPVLAYRGY